MKHLILRCALLILASALPLPAQAATTRTFVSSTGVDTNNNTCAITQPCSTFAHAYSLTLPNGIITALDPGKYGPITITGPVTINGNGWAAITAPAQGNGITVNANSTDIVNLNGLEIDGAGAAWNGIQFNSGGNFTVSNCVLGNFVNPPPPNQNNGNGIQVFPTSPGTFTIDINNTVVSNSGNAGIFYASPSGVSNAYISIDHVAAAKSGGVSGMLFGTPAATGGSTYVSVSNSVASNNLGSGIQAGGTGMILAIDNTVISGNGHGGSFDTSGIFASGFTHVQLSRSSISGNKYGIRNSTDDHTFYSYGDNHINGNDTDINTDQGFTLDTISTE
jgi:hypothetical protein